MAFPSPPARRSIARHGASEEHQCAHGGYHAEDKTDDGCGTPARFEFPRGDGGGQRAEHQPHDFRAQVLDDGRAVQAKPSGHIAFEARYADPHVCRVAEQFCSHTAIRPMTAPTMMMPGVVAKRFFLISYSFPNVLADTPCVRWLHPERGKRRNAFTASPRLHTQKGGERLHALSASEQTMRTSHRGFCLSSISCAYTALVHHP